MKPIVHTYTSEEAMLKVNAFIVESDNGLVIIDTTLTMSDSKALRQKAIDLAKPIAGILLTHAHPDHIAGTYNIAPDGEIPIYALESVKKLMQETEQTKHAQWSAMFGDEWIPKWIYPDQIVKNGDTVNLAGLKFTVIDIGSGGDCEANSFWLLEGENPVAFIGDFLYKNNHTYMADGSILRWMANIEKYKIVLQKYHKYYVGHGGPCNFSDLELQREYFLDYCAEVLNATQGTAIFSKESKKEFEESMLSKYPSYGCQFMIALAADRVAEELKGSM